MRNRRFDCWFEEDDNMEMIKRKLNRGLHQRDQGMALIVSVVIIAILIVFTFSLTLIAYTLYSSQNKNIASMRCREAANTLSSALFYELTFTDETQTPKRYPEYDSYLYKYLRYNICQDDVTWPYYEPGTDGHGKEDAFRYFDLKPNPRKKVYDKDGNELKQDETEEAIYAETVEGLPGKTEVCIYWRLPKDCNSVEYPLGKNLPSREGIRLFVEVTCEAASQSYTVTREYALRVALYDNNDKDEWGRQEALFGAAVNGNEAINPCQISVETDLVKDEKWIWELQAIE